MAASGATPQVIGKLTARMQRNQQHSIQFNLISNGIVMKNENEINDETKSASEI